MVIPYTLLHSKPTAAVLTEEMNLVYLCPDGDVRLYDPAKNTDSLLFTARLSFTSAYGTFDPTAPSSLYTMDGYVAVVNDYGVFGFLYHPDRPYPTILQRGEHQADRTPFPLAFFKNDAGVPHILYGEDWNLLHIADLTTLQNLTAAKSRIEENAEERWRTPPDRNPNSLLWPLSFDYFYGSIGLAALNKEGRVLFHNAACCSVQYMPETEHFLIRDKNKNALRCLQLA